VLFDLLHGQTPAAVMVTASNNIIFDACEFAHLGSGGLRLSDGVNSITVQYCVFGDISSHAIQLGNGPNSCGDTDPVKQNRDLLVHNNRVWKAGVEYSGGQLLYSGVVKDAVYRNNYFKANEYTGVCIGARTPVGCYGRNIEFRANIIEDPIRTLRDGMCSVIVLMKHSYCRCCIHMPIKRT